MKKQKVVILGSEQLNNQDTKTIEELQKGLSKVDQFPVYTPDLQWFEQMVITEQQNNRKKLLKDLSIFIMIACIILSGMIISLFQMPIIFIILQILTTIFIVFYTGIRFVKKVEAR